MKSNGDLWYPDVDVMLGVHHRKNPTADGGIKYKAKEIKIHPKQSFSHDLALLK